ncbi:MAG: hypothetical protein LBH20_03800 [Treponema sp.]|nr:hypothetical protein [Treponema sp.]
MVQAAWEGQRGGKKILGFSAGGDQRETVTRVGTVKAQYLHAVIIS